MSGLTLNDFLQLNANDRTEICIYSYPYILFNNTRICDLAGDRINRLCDRRIISFQVYSGSGYSSSQLLVTIESGEGDDVFCLGEL